MAISVLIDAITKLFQTDQTSPSRNRTQKFWSCGVAGYQAGGNLKISCGVFSETANIQ